MLKLKIISPERIVFDGEVKRVVVPGMLGEFEILENHAPIISSLNNGVVTYVPSAGDTNTLQLRGCFVEVQKNQISLCVEL